MEYRKGTLEDRVKSLLTELEPEAKYTIMAHELWRDEDGWVSNDRFRLATEVDIDRAIEVIRGRWEVFKANYAPRARVRDLELAEEYYNNAVNLEVAYLPFVDIETRPATREVIVGNIGRTYLGDSHHEAREDYDEYVKQSRSRQGRAGGEDVTLLANGEIVEEHLPLPEFDTQLAKAYESCWFHCPSGMKETGFAGKAQPGLYSRKRGIGLTEEGARAGEYFTCVPVSQAFKRNV